MIRVRNSILAGLAFGVLMSIFFLIQNEIKHPFIAGSIGGIGFALSRYYFSKPKK